MSGVLIYVILFIFVIFRMVRQGDKKGTGKSAWGGRNASSKNDRTQQGAGRGPLASDGHRMSKDQDVSCRRFGHRHEEFDTPRYIPHDDPEDGYIVLNGVKMKLSEADRYENRI